MRKSSLKRKVKELTHWLSANLNHEDWTAKNRELNNVKSQLKQIEINEMYAAT